MSDLKSNIAAFENGRTDLENQYRGQWVLFQNDAFVSAYDSVAEAARDAVGRFGRGPYLVRQVGARALTLPASVMFRSVYA